MDREVTIEESVLFIWKNEYQAFAQAPKLRNDVLTALLQ